MKKIIFLISLMCTFTFAFASDETIVENSDDFIDLEQLIELSNLINSDLGTAIFGDIPPSEIPGNYSCNVDCWCDGIDDCMNMKKDKICANDIMCFTDPNNPNNIRCHCESLI